MGRKRFSKTLLAAGTVFVLAVGMLGCSNKDKKDSTEEKEKAKASAAMVIDEQNHVTVTYAEDFDKDYYNAQELESAVDAELTEFSNAMGNSQAAVKSSFEVKNSKAILKITFCDYKAYSSYYEVDVDPKKEAPIKFYAVSCNEAEKIKDIKLNDKFKKVEDLSTATIANDEIGKLSVVCINQATDVSVPGEIVYISDNVTVSDGVAKTKDGELNYIFYTTPVQS